MSNQTIAILWGSETGTAQGLAETTEIRLNALGFQSQAIDMSDMNMENLPNFQNILVITSTWGDGDPPSNAMDLLSELQAKKVDLSGRGFSVCALGDTAYYQFCKCGKDFDEALEKQGAARIYPLQECDIDYDAPFEQWLEGIINVLRTRETANV
jgi:sulfite reductase (NADPH) flavoprotein alpha-component